MSHRRLEFPHIHHPLKSLHKKKKRRKEHKMKKKKKKDIKFTPVLAGVEEQDEEYSSFDFESDDSFESVLEGESDDAEQPRQVGGAGGGVVVKPDGVTVIVTDADQTEREITASKKPAVASGSKARPTTLLEVGESPTRHQAESPTSSHFPGKKVAKSKDSAEKLLPYGANTDLDASTPTRSNSKSSIASENEPPEQLKFLNRKMSDVMPRVMSTDSMQSDHSVAAQEFHRLVNAEPEPSKMFLDTDENSPLVSRQAIVSGDEDDDDPAKLAPAVGKVKFHLGGGDDDEPLELDSESKLLPETDGEAPQGKKKHRKKKRKYCNEHFNVEDLMERQRSGSDIIDATLKRVPTEPDEAALLQLSVLDDLKSHRFEDVRGIRRHKIRHSAMASIVQIGKKKRRSIAPPVKKYDHSPHEVFVELDELEVGHEKEWEWREKARWIKFEEDVEEGAERWGKPHVASLSFHSLLDLRQCLEKGTVILDLEANDLTNIAHKVCEKLVVTDQITEDQRSGVLRALLLKHRHVREKTSMLPRNISHANLLGIDRTDSDGSWNRGRLGFSPSKGSLHHGMSSTSSIKDKKDHTTVDIPDTGNHTKSKIVKIPSGTNVEHVTYSKLDQVKVDIDNNTEEPHDGETIAMDHLSVPSTATPTARRRSSILGTFHRPPKELEIMKKIPKGSETTSVLVGAVDFLDKPCMAFVRLAEGQLLSNLTEVPLPVRFLFILLGPDDGPDYHEIGRSISTLMSNKMFHDTAYRADSRQNLLDAINEFLGDSIVLPPGDWDRKTLLPIMDMAKRKATKALRHRRGGATEETLEEPILKDDGKEKKPEIDPLKRTGCLFGGLVNDVKRRFPHYLSDLKDGLNMQCLAALIFIYFACLSPAITFGGLLSEKTDNWIGVTELLLGTSVCGILFALFSGQPILILGFTGPTLVFEEALFAFCKSYGIEYISMRSWVGLWVTVITLIVIALEASFLIRYITRFTEEVFASLISLIFIYEVFNKIMQVFRQHPLMQYYPPPPGLLTTAMTPNSSGANDSIVMSPLLSVSIPDDNDDNITTTASVPLRKPGIYNQPNTALLTVILTFGTFFIAYFLRLIRNSHFLGRGARRAIGDFGIPIAIIAMTAVDFVIKDTFTQKLDVPDGLTPTLSSQRGWFINPLGMTKPLPVYCMFAAILPALLVFILLFMEQQITSVIVNKRGKVLKKGTGYHLDFFLTGGMAGLCGFLGLPFLCAASVRSVTHLSALIVMSRTHAPGEKPQLVEVKEQRLTGLFVHVLIGVSVLMGPVLRKIPMAVLFGVFLYMGISSMNGIEYFVRCSYLFMPVKHHADEPYVRRVKTWRMNLFTGIQTFCLALLWIVKSTAAALAFPFILILLVPVRLKLLSFVFTNKELEALDEGGEMIENNDEDDDDEPDFYEQTHYPR